MPLLNYSLSLSKLLVAIVQNDKVSVLMRLIMKMKMIMKIDYIDKAYIDWNIDLNIYIYIYIIYIYIIVYIYTRYKKCLGQISIYLFKVAGIGISKITNS